MIQGIIESRKRIHQLRPIIACWTNYVTADLVANTLLSLGASPVISDDPGEAEELVTVCHALSINIGTFNDHFVQCATNVMKEAQKQKKLSVLDPVGSGLTSKRTKTALELLPYSSVVRGNANEIDALSGSNQTKTWGVESLENQSPNWKSAQKLCMEEGKTIIITGRSDYVINNKRVSYSSRGSPMMRSVTGMGCALSATMALFSFVNKSPYEGSQQAMAYFNLCAEIAEKKSTLPGSFRQYFIDTLCGASNEMLCEHNQDRPLFVEL